MPRAATWRTSIGVSQQNDSSTETRNYYLYMAKNYSTLAEVVKLNTTQETREQRLF
jgi:hypothetical protein